MATPEQPETYSLRSAEAADASRVAELVDAAYGHYVERIGMLPGPMTNDYADVIRNRQVTVAERQGAIVGIIVLTVTDEGFLSTTSRSIPAIAGQGLDEPSSSSPKPRRNAPGSTPCRAPLKVPLDRSRPPHRPSAWNSPADCRPSTTRRRWIVVPAGIFTSSAQQEVAQVGRRTRTCREPAERAGDRGDPA
jgi:hypothetical protein